jgi:hypothetical protein
MVMQQYLEHGGTGQAFDEYTSIAAPPGTSLGDMSAQGVFAELGQALGLRPMGIYTPWASRTGDVNWEEISNPDTNVIAWEINDAQVNSVPTISFGEPLPFIVILTKKPMTEGEVSDMWNGTAYQPYETQAVYRQDDAKPVPTIYFMHWGERIDISKLPKQTLALVPKAQSVGGQLLFAAQVPSQGSTTRSPPATPNFQSAIEQQMALSVPIVTPSTPLPPIAAPAPAAVAAPSGKMNLSLPIAVALGAAVLTFVIKRQLR